MASHRDPIQPLVRQQFDRRLAQIREVIPALDPPRGGWVASLRAALGMSQASLARQVGVTQQTISQLEKREAEGTVTLDALRKAADALGGRLVYAIVPTRSIEKSLEVRARQLAAERIATVRHTMRLEDQEPETDAEARVEILARELLADPKKLW